MQRKRSLTLRSVIITIVLIPVNCYWIFHTESMWWAQFPTSMSLFFNVVFFLLVIACVNLLIRRFFPRVALSDWSMNWMWASLLTATCIKWVTLKYGGVRSYRKAIPFFSGMILGMILGEFAVGSIWSITGAAIGMRMYAFKNW